MLPKQEYAATDLSFSKERPSRHPRPLSVRTGLYPGNYSQMAVQRPKRQVALESMRQRRTSSLFEGGMLDSQMSDSQVICSMIDGVSCSVEGKSPGSVNSATCGNRPDMDALGVSVTVEECTFDDVPESQPREVPDIHTQELKALMGENDRYSDSDLEDLDENDISTVETETPSSSALSHPYAKCCHQQLGDLPSRELQAFQPITALLHRYRQEISGLKNSLNHEFEERVELERRVRFLEGRVSQLAFVLVSHAIDIPDEEASQYV
ncbi:hypothetical protein C8Q76DRAFT_691928 [Earliella scabrosa]|nr:hypothetical protein C8Q76DRAFT_691928 [Earliella scabrosa]